MTQVATRNQFDSGQLDLIRNTVAKGTTNEQFLLFVEVCKQTGLNPFARQIYAVVRNEWNKDTRTKEPKMVVQTSIDGYRLLAQRSGEYAGQDGPYWYDEKTKEWVDVWLSSEPPAAAKVGVMRRGFAKPIYAVARFESYAVRAFNEATRKQDGELTNLWKKMPELMIAKVAESLALRRTFPAELSGIYIAEEMSQADAPLTMPRMHVQPAPHDESSVEVVNGEVVNDAITDQQLASIQKLCQALRKSEPDNAATLTSVEAKAVIQQLSAEYRALKAKSAPPTSTPVPTPPKAPASMQTKPVLDMIGRAKGSVEALDMVWDDAKRDAGFIGVADGDLTVTQVAQINSVIAQYKEKRNAA